MAIIDRYLLSELFKVLLSILLVLSLILISLGFVKLLEKVAVGDMNPEVVFPLMGYQILRFLARSIPAAFFLSILMVLGRMYRDSEMTALSACGIGTRRIFGAFGLALIPLVAVTAWLAVWVQPWAAGQMEKIVAQQKQEAAELVGLQPGRFNEYSRGELVFYVEELDRDKEQMHNVFIQNRQHGKLGLISAGSGHHTYDEKSGDHFLTLLNGRRYEGDPGAADFVVSEFGAYTLRIAESAASGRDVRAARPSAQLYQSEDIHDRTEFWERVSFPFSLITLTLIAIPLSRSLPRQGLYGRMFFAFLVYFAFLNLHAVSVSWMKKQVTPEWLGIWWVQVVLLLLAGIALALDSGWLRRLRRRLRRPSKAQVMENRP
jgi:lipopolysaccharide export system permease protein